MKKLPIEEKKCTICKEILNLDKFPKRKYKEKIYYLSYCFKCRYQKEKEYSLSKKAKEIRKKYYYNNKEKIYITSKKYRNKNQKRINEYYKLYNNINKEERAKYLKNWRLKNIDKMRLLERIRAAKRKSLKIASDDGTITENSIKDLLIKQNNKCYYCNKTFKKKIKRGKQIRIGYDIEHMIPLIKGGKNSIYNIVLSCPNCNNSKYNKTAEEFKNG